MVALDQGIQAGRAWWVQSKVEPFSVEAVGAGRRARVNEPVLGLWGAMRQRKEKWGRQGLSTQ